MPKHFSRPSNSLFEQDKDNKILSFIKIVRFLQISEKGSANIAARFGITLEDLKQRIAEFEERRCKNE